MNPDVSPYDALLLALLRRPGEARRRRALPRERHPRPRHPARAARGGRGALLPLRRPQPDQRPEPRLLAAIREDLAGSGIDLPVYWGNRNWDPYLADTLRQMRDDGIQRAAVHHHVGVLVVLLVPAVPREPRRRGRRGRGRARGSTGCGSTSTTRASWSPSSTRRWPRWPTSPTRCARAPSWSSSPTRSPTAMAETSGRRSRAATPTCASTSRVAEEITARVRQETGRRHQHDLVYCSRSGSPRVAVAGARRQRPPRGPRQARGPAPW